MPFNLEDFCRKNGKGKLSLKCANGARISINAHPASYTPAAVAKAAKEADKIKVTFPDKNIGEHLASQTSVLTGEVAGQAVLGALTGRAAEESDAQAEAA